MAARDPYIDAATLKSLSKLNTPITAFWMLFDWIIIALAIAISTWASNPFVYVLAVLVIAGRMHGFAVIVHEFAHYRFMKNKTTSDWIGDIVLAWPIFGTIDTYRQNHLAHHRHTNTEDDPDWTIKLHTEEFTFPQTRVKAFLNFLGYLTLKSTFRDFRSAYARIGGASNYSTTYKLLRLAFYLAAAGLITWFGVWLEFLLYWFVPYLTVFFFLLYIRSVAEHFGSMDYEEELGSTRHVDPYFWERWFFCPHNVNYHLDHHLFPSVPFYNLPALHEKLLENAEYRKKAHITRGYSTGLVNECLA